MTRRHSLGESRRHRGDVEQIESFGVEVLIGVEVYRRAILPWQLRADLEVTATIWINMGRLAHYVRAHIQRRAQAGNV